MSKLRGHYRIVFLLVILVLVAYVAYNLTSSSKTLSRSDLAAQDFAKHSQYKPSYVGKPKIYKSPFNDDRPFVVSNADQQDLAPDVNIPALKVPTQHVFYAKPMPEPASLYKEIDKNFLIYFENKERLVHLDLKGAPPKVNYYDTFFPLIKRLGATGLLIEYEDMFPYSGNLSELAAANHYSVPDIQRILRVASDNGLQVIPLVQTFGHMEFVLKYKTFQHLREDSTTPQVICPTREESFRLVGQMIDQIMALHPEVKSLHIGSDEVYQLGHHKSKPFMEEHNISATDLFFKHVHRVASYIIDNHHVQPIMWDDMFRHIDERTLVESGIADVVQPMIWSYGTNPYETLRDEIWPRYGKVFRKVWIASSFKGATGSAQFANNITHHLQNHFHWVEMMKRFDAVVPRHLQFIGVALTGWQRYDHFATLCELLPAALPSLAANLQTLKYGGFDHKTHTFVSQELGCKTDMPLELDSKVEVVTKCNFTGNEIYYASRMLWNQTTAYEHYTIQSRLNGWLTDYNIKRHFGSTGQLSVLQKRLVPVLNGLFEVKSYMEKPLTNIFGDDTREEWLDVQITARVNTIKDILKKVDLLLEDEVWPQRPLPPADAVTPPQGAISGIRNMYNNVVNKLQNQVLHDESQGVNKDAPSGLKVPSQGGLNKQAGSDAFQGQRMKQFDESKTGIKDRQLLPSRGNELPEENGHESKVASNVRSQHNFVKQEKQAGVLPNQPSYRGEKNADLNGKSNDKYAGSHRDLGVPIENNPMKHAGHGDSLDHDNGDHKHVPMAGSNALPRLQRAGAPLDPNPQGNEDIVVLKAPNQEVLDTLPKQRHQKLRDRMSEIRKITQS